jgi:hypothetical protein
MKNKNINLKGIILKIEKGEFERRSLSYKPIPLPLGKGKGTKGIGLIR